MDHARLATVADLWQAHRDAPFPARLRNTDIAGVEMVTLDSFTAGCVSTWLQQEGTIDDRRWDILAVCEQRLQQAIPHLTGAEATYYQRLLDMTILILEA